MKRRAVWIVLSCLMFVASAALIIYYLWGNGYWFPTKKAPPPSTYAEFTYPEIDASEISAYLETITATTTSTEPQDPNTTVEPDPNLPDVPCPVDFTELQAVNPDIIGWLYMTEPAISLPILRHINDDTFYLYHDAVGQYQRDGSLFVEHLYNGPDFEDPLTVIYGHRMSSGTMFGTMQATMSQDGFFDQDRYFVIFTPKDTKIFKIFAAIPSDNQHILYYNDFNTEDGYEAYFDDLFMRSGVEVHLIPEARPTYGDHVVVLSSCLWGDRTNRYLVFAKEI